MYISNNMDKITKFAKHNLWSFDFKFKNTYLLSLSCIVSYYYILIVTTILIVQQLVIVCDPNSLPLNINKILILQIQAPNSREFNDIQSLAN
jgi:hypothetical protein